ncbi:hypothetical protein GH714_023866 [Hevea brasiliensis]|uniref:Uncharacterized protein n=1 Tax=Hevea brasiliensis TaxID=3981 RepID=A0A6A6KCX7_HEVBR|nr:hypothetical protein GH714_023866 [Hevea brasiliensis]
MAQLSISPCHHFPRSSSQTHMAHCRSILPRPRRSVPLISILQFSSHSKIRNPSESRDCMYRSHDVSIARLTLSPKHRRTTTSVSDSGLVEVLEEKNPDLTFKHLKELHSWADESLIEDVMANVNNDIDKATILLEEMISTDNSEENGEAKYLSNCKDFGCDKGENEIALLGQTSDLAADIADLSSTLENALKDNHKQLKDVRTACGHKLSEAAAANMKLILGHLRSLPVEPEWEEHDVYLSHRGTALRMMSPNCFVRIQRV